VRLLRARALVASGKTADALREIAVAEELHPVHLDLAVRLVPALEVAGAKDEAGQLFERVAGRWLKACEAFPLCAESHNQLGWLFARCRRRLDEALMHATKAVESDPSAAGYLDTLAEVHFQRGDRAKAIELIKKCLKMSSGNVGFYQQQLKRFETGNPKDEPAE